MVEKLAAVVIILVVVAVVVGFIRLALDHWGYILLAVLAVCAGYYVYRLGSRSDN